MNLGLCQQPKSEGSNLICFDESDAKRIYITIQENVLLREKIKLLEDKVRNVEKERDNLTQESLIKDKLIEVVEKKAEVEHNAYLREKELTEKAIQLADVTMKKSQSNWQLQGLLGLAAFVVGFMVGK